MAGRENVGRFLACRRVALVGASRDKGDFSRGMMRELLARGYDVVPVNPAASDIEGRTCFPRVAAVSPPVEAALVMTPPAQTAEATRDCLEAGVGTIWFHGGVGPGSATTAALQACAERGTPVVEGECVYMHLPRTGLVHRVHGFFRHLGGGR